MPQTRMSSSSSQGIAALRATLTAHGRPKRAGLGSADGQDVPFEQAFSNLAHAYLRDLAPSLLDHEVGFQLLDRNQQNTKAIGVFGFKVGSHWLYAPVFFLRGDLKGHELLYLKNQDMFVPLKESWLNYILNRKPNMLGEGVDRNSANLGAMQPDFSRLRTSPGKIASARPSLREMVDAVMPVFADVATSNVADHFDALGKHVNLPEFLKSAGLTMLDSLVQTCLECPALAASLEQFHGLGVIDAAIKSASVRRQQANRLPSILDKQAAALSPAPQPVLGSILSPRLPHPIKTGSLRVLQHDLTIQTELPPSLDEEDSEKLRRDGLLIKDERSDSEISIPYHLQVEQRLTNPTESGLYEVLVKPGDYEECFVMVHPMGATHRSHFCTVIRTGDEPNWVNIPAQQIWVGSKIEGKPFERWYDGLPEANSLSKGRTRYVIIGPRGEGTLPFRVEREYGDAYGSSSYEVDLEDYCGHTPTRTASPREHYDQLNYDPWRDGCRLHLNGKKGSMLRSVMGDIYVPEGFKLLKVKKDKHDDQDSSDGPCCAPVAPSSEPPPIRPGNILDVELQLFKTSAATEAPPIELAKPTDVTQALRAKLASLSVYHDGSEVEINRRRMSARAGLIHLVRDHGFREATAHELLKRAAVRGKFTCDVKYASPYLTESGPTAPQFPEPVMGNDNMMGSNIPTQLGIDQAMPVQGTGAQMTDPQTYNPNTTLDRRDVGTIQRAAQTGQKEIFDTAMIGSMLKAVRDDTMVDRYLGDLMKGLDRLGRILFMFFWHSDEFADRYGKSDMPELEDSLRNSFEALGDVVLFLRQKSIEPYPEESDTDTDLGAVATA